MPYATWMNYTSECIKKEYKDKVGIYLKFCKCTLQVLNLDWSCAYFHHQLQYVHNELHKKHHHGDYDFHPQYHHGYNVFHHQCHHGHDRNVNNAINQGRGQLAFHWTNGKCKRTKVTQPGTLSFYLYLGNNFDLWKMRKNLKLIFGSWNRHIWSVFGVNFDN